MLNITIRKMKLKVTKRYQLIIVRITILKKTKHARSWWLTLIILATQEAEIRRIAVGNQPRQIVCDPISKILNTKRTGRVAQVVEYLLSKRK
jgi:hypothetical protein